MQNSFKYHCACDQKKTPKKTGGLFHVIPREHSEQTGETCMVLCTVSFKDTEQGELGVALVSLLLNYTVSSQHTRNHVSAVSKRRAQHDVLVLYVFVTPACEAGSHKQCSLGI